MQKKFNIVFLNVVLVITAFLFCIGICGGKASAAEESYTVWLDELDISKAFALSLIHI